MAGEGRGSRAGRLRRCDRRCGRSLEGRLDLGEGGLRDEGRRGGARATEVSSMKAAVCYERNQPVLVEDVTLDAPRRDEVRVRLSASGVCHSDLSFVHGILPGKLPCVLGHEGAGVVEEVGEGVAHLAPGDKVVLSWVTPCGRCFYCRLGKPHLCEVGERINKTNRMPDGST